MNTTICKAAEQYFPINAMIHVHQAGVVPDMVFITVSKFFVLTSYEFQNYKISYAGESEHPLFHEMDIFATSLF
jgi:hypothetical protein